KLGAFGTLKRDLKSNNSQFTETFSTNTNGTATIDSVVSTTTSGKVTYPGSYGFGAMFYKGERWLLGADFTKTLWSQYRFFGQQDQVQDAWKMHVGGQILPNFINAKSYWGRVTYRAGFNYGQDYVHVEENLPVWGISLGMGLPMRPPSYTNQYSIINLAVEFGQRGNNTNIIRENYLRISFGLTLSDLWFVKRKYD
ncbi:MAG: hypothetical protein ABI415_03895, partial [Flavitalea sp.]